jgi:hypothetical protein
MLFNILYPLTVINVSAALEVPIEAPTHVKKDIARKLQKSGALRRIETKIKLGMMVAVEEIREDPKQLGALERHRFKDASPHELRGLQLVYRFLAERGLTYTLSTLAEKSCVRRTDSERTSLLSLVRAASAPRSPRRLVDEEEEEEPSRGRAVLARASAKSRTLNRNRSLINDDDL